MKYWVFFRDKLWTKKEWQIHIMRHHLTTDLFFYFLDTLKKRGAAIDANSQKASLRMNLSIFIQHFF